MFNLALGFGCRKSTLNPQQERDYIPQCNNILFTIPAPSMKNKTQHHTGRIGFTFMKANVSVSLMSLVWCLNSINHSFSLYQHKKTKQQQQKINQHKTLYNGTEK